MTLTRLDIYPTDNYPTGPLPELIFTRLDIYLTRLLPDWTFTRLDFYPTGHLPNSSSSVEAEATMTVFMVVLSSFSVPVYHLWLVANVSLFHVSLHDTFEPKFWTTSIYSFSSCLDNLGFILCT